MSVDGGVGGLLWLAPRCASLVVGNAAVPEGGSGRGSSGSSGSGGNGGKDTLSAVLGNGSDVTGGEEAYLLALRAPRRKF